MSASNMLRRRLAPAALTLAVVCALGACKKEDAATTAGAQAVQKAAAAPTPESVVSASVSAMNADQLREAGNKAYGDNRLYAPAGNNAMEFYLALRDKQPGDVGASSALSDLLPMTVIATEQGIAREDFEEAKRLIALIGKADGNHPALARLKASIDRGEASFQQQVAAQKLSVEEEAKRRVEMAKKREEDQRRLQEQQRQQTQLQAQQLAQQEQAAREAAQREQAQREQAQREQAQREAAQREAAQRQQASQPARASNELRAVSTPGPKFPPSAQRSGASGSVQVEFTVGTDGSIANARVVSTDASRQFQREFEREALNAVKRWRFQPVGQATTSRRTIEFTQ